MVDNQKLRKQQHEATLKPSKSSKCQNFLYQAGKKAEPVYCGPVLTSMKVFVFFNYQMV